MRKQLFCLLCAILLLSCKENYKSFPMWNYHLPVEERVEDLIARLTLEEKIAQMLHATPAIPRLGIPAYNWWNEALHGVARTPYNVTSFPQAIAMAATWDTGSMRQMASYTATEGRAVYRKAIEEGREGEQYAGLTYWTPNINIFRDPRWGRGQETYGEDPFLTAAMGAAFVNGLQGNHPKYLKAAACAKHFAVHSGPELTRHSDNFNPSSYDLWDTYLPAFQELVTNAGVAGIMCAYNAVNTQPCCANNLLMQDILREKWGFTGYVTSDCWGIDDFFRYHKTHKDAAASAIDALANGTDIECGVSVYTTLLASVQNGLIEEEQINESLRRLFTIRFRLGMFDPPSEVPYAQIPVTALEAPEHAAHALKMARQSIVLLKNDNNTLPLKKSIKKIAVLGPNADNEIAVLGNYYGIPSEVVTVLEGIKTKLPDTEVLYEKAIGFTNDSLMEYNNLSDYFIWNGKKGFKAEYFNNRELEGAVKITRQEEELDLQWQQEDFITNNFKANNFSARYTTGFTGTDDGYTILEITANDGFKLFINNELVLDKWKNNHGAATYRHQTVKGRTDTLIIEYWQGEEQSRLLCRTGNLKKTNFNQLKETIKEAEAIIFVGGISPELEGEQMPVGQAGFQGGDRTTIQLPDIQTELLKQLNATGKPVVFVMMTGSAIAITEEDKNIPAIINAWYGGQSAGTAIADVLFGDYNPAGRLPVSFYRSDADLPDFSDYSMQNRTYRYFKGKPLYPFGYGLSYTSFQYSSMSMLDNPVSDTGFTVSVTVKNTGERDGEEVVQLYLSWQGIQPAPIRALKGFKRIFLSKGEEKRVSFTVSKEQLLLINKHGEPYLPQGTLQVCIGGCCELKIVVSG